VHLAIWLLIAADSECSALLASNGQPCPAFDQVVYWHYSRIEQREQLIQELVDLDFLAFLLA
jgi:hypothetical protein